MQLYRWSSKAMAQYRSGTIIVMAVDVDAARAKVRAQMGETYRRKKLLVENDEPHFLLALTDEAEQEDWIEWRDKVEQDIASEPRCDDVIFLDGSE